jgi:hypothetical protein
MVAAPADGADAATRIAAAVHKNDDVTYARCQAKHFVDELKALVVRTE